MTEPTRLVVGMSGSSGAIYGIRLLEILKGMPEVETHLVVTPAARQTIVFETDWTPSSVASLADFTYRPGDIAAPISSGSFPIDAMIVLPCSVRSLGAIAWSQNDSLLVRAADVTLKERRKLVVALRETPLHLGHLRAMTQVTEMGGILAPLMPAFYGRPATLGDLVDHQVGRLCDLLGIRPPDELVERWHGPARG
ncbi:UbiX family flavin prenyltransferase [Amycolatopsis australiensis]|uniref:Flavin prenyltransferase UbiX n=1 Tax=Amycolatopsis australiensis TaxID=546364 RepID=A0A1K1RV20_9PSEU|nr:UbiX family flavin prenyltransferase [Amycolatopsis australiensis]SFW75583.1 4-hydroxy-3-polyprenylbenzoate decarboxylase [Amycolatopsis australiensis]